MKGISGVERLDPGATGEYSTALLLRAVGLAAIVRCRGGLARFGNVPNIS